MKIEMHWSSQANIVWSGLDHSLGFVYMCMWMLWIRVWRINMRLVHDLHEAASNINEAMSLTAVCGWHWYSDTETVIYAMYTEGFTVVVLAPQRDNWVYIKMKRALWHQGWMKSVLSVCGISSILIIVRDASAGTLLSLNARLTFHEQLQEKHLCLETMQRFHINALNTWFLQRYCCAFQDDLLDVLIVAVD